MSVSPFFKALRQRSRAWRLTPVAPESSSLKTSGASGFLERRYLHGGVLVVGADTRIGVFHAPIVRLNCETRKPLFYGHIPFVSKPYPSCETDYAAPSARISSSGSMMVITPSSSSS